jgi:MFS family permease
MASLAATSSADNKYSVDHVDKSDIEKQHPAQVHHDLSRPHDKALDALGDDVVHMTDEQSRMVCRKIDRAILPILMWVYFLQILDKSCVGYGAAFGMKEQANLKGDEYSTISSAGYWAQLALCCGPTAFLIVKVRTNLLLGACILFWGTAMLGLAFSKNFGALLCNRFLLGLFEAIAIPLFTVITATWYRRREQPLRIACWYGTNGVASMLGSLLAYGLSFIQSPHLYVYQILFLTVGLATVLTAPLLYWRLDNSPAEARFLTPEEKRWAIERLRDNQTGVETKVIKWNQVWETFYAPPMIFYALVTFCVNTGASVTNTFGPLIIRGFGFDARQTMLLNIPFGFVQTCVCFAGCLLAARFGYKGAILMSFMIPCVFGSAMLYGIGDRLNGLRLFSYYCIAFLFGGNPLLFAWLAGNTGGHTKKSLSISLCNAASAIGNMVGPYLFKSGAPLYHTGLGACMGIFCACFCLCAGLVFTLFTMNKRKEKQRVANGKPAKIANASMEKEYRRTADGVLGQQAFDDLTDLQNDEFVYAY